jgi:ketosteroid isomerase-like protein
MCGCVEALLLFILMVLMVIEQQGGHVKRTATACCIFIVLGSAGIGPTKDGEAALRSLVESERAFARTCLEKGIRTSFAMFFDDDAMVFRPGPVKYKEVMKSVPPPKNPLETTLKWEPVYADISRSGDFGYTTGPSMWTDNRSAKRPASYGFYFSVWKKNTGGEWKVVFDIGNELAGPYTGPRALRSPAPGARVQSRQKLSPAKERLGLMKTELDFLARSRNHGSLKALREFLQKESRVYRQREQPIVGSDSIRAYFSVRPYFSMWEPMSCDVAASGDLGYVYGSYTLYGSRDNAAKDEKGYYIRMWKRDSRNQWRLVAEIASPLPGQELKTKQ